MKKILILSASFGEGHNSAGRGIRDALAQIAPGETEVEFHDLFAAAYGRFNEVVRRSYLGVINHVPGAWAGIYKWLDKKQDFSRNFRWFGPVRTELASTLARLRPDIVVSVYPAYGYLLDQILGRDLRADCKRVVCVTDSITVNAIWYRCAADYFLVPNEQSAEVLRTAGIGDDAIRAYGFPVSPKFALLAPNGRSDPNGTRPRLLYMINAGRSMAPHLVRKLVDLDVDLTVTVGHDERLRRAVAAAVAGVPRSIEVIGWTERMPQLLAESHLLIGKAGGATVQETIAAGCPMIVNQIVPGQEEGNARLIAESGSGAIALTADAVVEKVQSVFANGRQEWQEWRTNIRSISRPRAALDIAEFLLSI